MYLPLILQDIWHLRNRWKILQETPPPIALTESAVFLKKVNVLRLPELHCNVSALYFRSADCPKEKQYAVKRLCSIFHSFTGITAVNHAYLLDAWTVSWRYHREAMFFLFLVSPVKQKYPNRLIRSFFKYLALDIPLLGSQEVFFFQETGRFCDWGNQI